MVLPTSCSYAGTSGPLGRMVLDNDAAIRKISSIPFIVCWFARIRWRRGDVLFDCLH